MASIKKGKRLKALHENLDQKKVYSLKEAVVVLKDVSKVKFDETLELAMNLGVVPKHSDQMVRGVISLPNGTGKSIRVAVFAKDDKAEEAKAAGADVVGSDDLAEQVKAGKIDFEHCIATPDMMPLVGQLGRVLGPKGLMPNPKLGSVTPNVAEAVKLAKSGQVEFRTEKAGVIHAGLGKLSFTADKLSENVKVFIDAVNKAKPSGVKGTYIKSLTLSSTMGPGLLLEISELLDEAA